MKFCAYVPHCATRTHQSLHNGLRSNPSMPDRIAPALQDKISQRLRFYQDLGIDLFYRDRSAPRTVSPPRQSPPDLAVAQKEATLPKPVRKPEPIRPAAIPAAPRADFPGAAKGISLFDCRVAG